MTRRICGRSCLEVSVLTEEHYRKAVRNLLSFDLVFTMERMGQADMGSLCEAAPEWCSFIANQKPRVGTASGIHAWLAANADSPLARRVLDITALDRRLYRVAQARHAGTPSLTAEQFF